MSGDRDSHHSLQAFDTGPPPLLLLLLLLLMVVAVVRATQLCLY